MVAVGFTLQPDDEFLDLCGDLLRRDVDYFEVAPETTWRPGGDRRDADGGDPGENGFAARFAALGAETGKPFVAHGVGFSIGGADAADAGRRRRWLRALARDQRRFDYQWFTDHLGVSAPAGLALALPLPLPMTGEAARAVRRRLASLRRIFPAVGVENTAHYFLLGDPLDEPRFLARAIGAAGWLLLDLHNVHTMAVNLGFCAEAYLDRLDLGRVIEIHLAGGAESDPRWLPSRRVFRLDGHDGAVPEAVWRLYERVAPRCRRLRGVTLERMEGTVGPADVPLLRDELRRARQLARRLP